MNSLKVGLFLQAVSQNTFRLSSKNSQDISKSNSKKASASKLTQGAAIALGATISTLSSLGMGALPVIAQNQLPLCDRKEAPWEVLSLQDQIICTDKYERSVIFRGRINGERESQTVTPSFIDPSTSKEEIQGLIGFPLTEPDPPPQQKQINLPEINFPSWVPPIPSGWNGNH